MRYSVIKQQGAILIVSLVFLLLITVIALSTVSSSTLQTIMASNSQQRESNFRVAEAAAEQALIPANITGAENASAQNSNKPRAFNVAAASLSTDQEDVTMTAQVFYLGRGAAADASKAGGGGGSLGTVETRIYESRGQARSGDGKTRTEIIQGAAMIAFGGASRQTYDP